MMVLTCRISPMVPVGAPSSRESLSLAWADIYIHTYRRMVIPAVVPGDTSPGQGFWMALLYLFPVQFRQGLEFMELSSFREAFVTGTGGA